MLLRNAKKELKNGTLRVGLSSAMAATLIKNHSLAERLQKAIGEMTGCYCDVECEAYDGEMLELPDIEKTIYRMSAYKQAAKQEQVREANPEPKPKQETNPANGGGEHPRRRPKKKETAPGCIFGGGVDGRVIPIQEIENEAKDIVVLGEIESVDSRDFKETTLLFFDVADETQGISMKSFFRDHDEFEKAIGALKVGMRVRVKGSIRFDTYQNDLVMFADSIKEEPVTQREDNAEEKRVELHLHTQMSALDAVVSTKKVIQTAARWGWPAVAITDHGVVQAFPEAMDASGKYGIKIIYGMEGYLTGDDYKQRFANHIILLAKNLVGLHNLYKLVSVSHLRFFYRGRPRIPKPILEEFREGLIIGSACEAGELIRAIVAHKSDEELIEIASFYDYLEIQPIGNNAFLKRSSEFPDVQTDDDLIKINLKVAELAKKLDKMLIATCDVHFLNPEDAIYRTVIMAGNGFEDAEQQPPL
jgi:DNA polymerase-3 subunit alpha (Gram-positive type)